VCLLVVEFIGIGLLAVCSPKRIKKKETEKYGKQVQSLTKVTLAFLMGTNVKGLHPICTLFCAENSCAFHQERKYRIFDDHRSL
jgi:hypothetical protein